MVVHANGPFSNIGNIRVFIFDKVLVVQAAITKHTDNQENADLIEHDILEELNSGFLIIRNSEIKLPDSYHYSINKFQIEKDGLLEIHLRIERDYRYN